MDAAALDRKDDDEMMTEWQEVFKRLEQSRRERSLGQPLRKYYELQRVHEDEDRGFWITTPLVDLEGDRIVPEGVDLQLYEKIGKPVFWLHDHYGATESAGIPIGSSKSLQVLPGLGIRTLGIEWTEGDPFAARIRNAFEQRKIRGASIGFIPTEWRPNEHGGHDILRSKLLEWSLVPIPANPAAVRLSKEELLAMTRKIAGDPPVRRHPPGPASIPREGIFLEPEEYRALRRHVLLRAAIARLQRAQLLQQFPFLAMGDGLDCVDRERMESYARGFGEFYE